MPTTEPEPPARATSGGAFGSVFASFLGQGQARRPAGRARTLTVAVSLAGHGLLIAVGVVVSFWHVDELSAPGIPVTFLSAPTPPPPPAPPSKASSPRRPRMPRPTLAAVVQPPRPEPGAQSERQEEAEEPEASDHGVAGGVAGGIVGGQVGGVVPPLDPGQRRSLLERYLRELFRSRIAARFRYPPEAERAGIEGVVVMRVAIDGNGRLIEVHLVGSCQHAVLCEAASRTLLDSAPFPPPPAELGGSIAIDVPLSYRLE